ncbi:hypothetical protein F5Y01DRAFT_297301 [Xylaria sp. FL0043]|nr:hypothetical protein F5Y01DRAFT_297301 [Xylaria sp. FL0043]
MPNPTPRFWAGPLRYWRWAAREKPAFFWSCVIGGAGPVILLTVPPTLKRLGYERAAPIPMTYPGSWREFSFSLFSFLSRRY